MATEDDVRRIALSLPEAVEHPSYGGRPGPAFRVGKKNFAYIWEDGECVVVYVADLDEKEALLASDDGTKLFTTPHHDPYPTVLVRWAHCPVDELAELITESWRLKAPKRVAASYDG